MMSNEDRLVYMANQIARNMAVHGEEQAIAETADHIASFWDPRMRQMIFARLDAGGEGLESVARQAVERLREQAATT